MKTKIIDIEETEEGYLRVFFEYFEDTRTLIFTNKSRDYFLTKYGYEKVLEPNTKINVIKDIIESRYNDNNLIEVFKIVEIY